MFVHDQQATATTLVTLSPSGEDAAGQITAMSADGRVVAYLSGNVDRDGNQMRNNDVLVYEAPRAR